MSEIKFTPGPWTIYPETDGTDICAVDDAPGLPIRQIVAHPERGANWIGNAHLIAAAPDMYKTLEWLLHIHSIPGIARGEIQKALAKARGEA